MLIYNLSAAFLDATIDSIYIQQARKDPTMGQSLFASYNMTWFVFGALFGGSILIINKDPYIAFQIGGTVAVLLTIGGFLLSDDVENNKYAMMAIELENAVFIDDK